jgi:IMP cyclohydrolase
MHELAQRTLERCITRNRYPGRGLILGRNTSGGPGQGDWTLVYWIMGRSEHSRNRQFVAQGGALRTQAFDPKLLVDPSLIIYEAMLELPGIQLISNGDQTRTIYDALSRGGSFEQALAGRAHEPDAPHYTPRISGMLDLRAGQARLSLGILRANPHDPLLTDRTFFQLAEPPPGVGRCITTYDGDGNPLPSFSGEPLVVPCQGGGSDILHSYWQALDADNRIALAVKTLHPDGSCRELLVKNCHA